MAAEDVFWDDLHEDLKDPGFLRDYVSRWYQVAVVDGKPADTGIYSWVVEVCERAWEEGYTAGNRHNGRRDANPYRRRGDTGALLGLKEAGVEIVGEFRQCSHGYHHPPWAHSCDGCWCEGEHEQRVKVGDD